MKTKRLFSLLLCVCMALTLLPTVTLPANAADTSAMTLGTSGIGAGDMVYFGNYTESGTDYNVPWVVLDDDRIPTPESGTGLPLLSEYLLGKSQFQSDVGYYSGSTLQSTMSSIYNDFTTQEQGAVLETTLTKDSMYSEGSDLGDQKLFPLSYDEVVVMGENDDRIAHYITDQTGSAGWWWLRSSNIGIDAYCVFDDGSFNYVIVNVINGVRPAFNLNQDSVLFASAAEGGKFSSLISGSVLPESGENSTGAWKLTLYDTDQTVTLDSVTRTGNTVSIAYSDATRGTNQYVSAYIADSSGDLISYGKLASTATVDSGTASLTLPDRFDTNGYKLYLISEKCNADYITDYASTPQEVDVSTIPDSPTIGSAIPGNAQITVSWTAPASDGGSDITGYTVYYEETADFTKNDTVSAAATDTSATVTGLTNGTGYTFKVLATNSVGNSEYSGTVTATPLDSNAMLSGLVISSGTLSPAFDTGTTAYTASVSNSVKSVTVTPTASETNAPVTVNGVSVTSGDISDAISLDVGSNTITVIVTAQDGSTNTYTITVTRAAASSSSGGGSSSSTTYYTITATVGTGGSITPSGSASVAYGNDKTYTVAADEGYEIEDVLVDGASVGAVSTYTFENVKKAHTITASFKEKKSENTDESVINPFTDVDTDDWFYDSVMYAYENGLMNGNSGHFNPDEDMTRAMLVTVLYRMSGDTGSYTNTFSDVPSGEWYEQAAAWAAANGITSGIGGNCFGPDNGISREQLAVMLYNYAKYKGYDVSIGEDTNILSYNDALDISDYAYTALQWACGAGIISGDDNGNLNAQSSATRTEVAAMLQRFCENVIN